VPQAIREARLLCLALANSDGNPLENELAPITNHDRPQPRRPHRTAEQTLTDVLHAQLQSMQLELPNSKAEDIIQCVLGDLNRVLEALIETQSQQSGRVTPEDVMAAARAANIDPLLVMRFRNAHSLSLVHFGGGEGKRRAMGTKVIGLRHKHSLMNSSIFVSSCRCLERCDPSLPHPSVIFSLAPNASKLSYPPAAFRPVSSSTTATLHRTTDTQIAFNPLAPNTSGSSVVLSRPKAQNTLRARFDRQKSTQDSSKREQRKKERQGTSEYEVLDFRQFKCSTCGKETDRLSAMLRHLSSHNGARFKCDSPECGSVFSSFDKASKHMQTVHGMTKERPFKCRICSKTFVFEEVLAKHMSIHKPAFMCQICGSQFRKKQHLTSHMGFHATKALLRCSLCARSFVNTWTLKRHIASKHPDVDPAQVLAAVQNESGDQLTSSNQQINEEGLREEDNFDDDDFDNVDDADVEDDQVRPSKRPRIVHVKRTLGQPTYATSEMNDDDDNQGVTSHFVSSSEDDGEDEVGESDFDDDDDDNNGFQEFI
jgi:uncharacterized C2H2 Zn-finger protein